jgi:hypothetical protein
MKKLTPRHSVFIVFICLILVLSCNLPAPQAQPTVANNTEKTLSAKATTLAKREKTLNAKLSAPTATDTAAPAATYTSQPTYTAYPTYTTAPQDPPTTQPQPTQTTAVQDMDALVKSANILVFEDIRGYPALLPRVHQAIIGMNLSGGKVVEVGDAIGNLMTELNSPTKWDLIIIAAEARSGVRGEFWDLILQQAKNKVALAIEVWYIDKDYFDKLNYLMDDCGISLQKNWSRPDNYQLLNYSIYWLNPQHPLFSVYKIVAPLVTPTIYWAGDAGDLIKLKSGSNAELLAGTQPNEKSTYGTLATCMDGRMVMQTFSSHDYQQDKTVALWQNYIYYTLMNHFKAIQ